MASKITLNNNIGTELEIIHPDNSSARSISSSDMTVAVNTVSDLPTDASNGDVVIVRDYHSGLEGGGGTFVYDSTRAKSEHNGGTVIDPTAVFPTDWNSQTQLGTWFDTNNVSTGVWVRKYEGAVNAKWFGAKGDGTSDDTTIMQTVLSKDFGHFYIPSGNYFIGEEAGIDLSSDTVIDCSVDSIFTIGYKTVDGSDSSYNLFSTYNKNNITINGLNAIGVTHSGTSSSTDFVMKKNLIYFESCDGIKLKNIKVENWEGWYAVVTGDYRFSCVLGTNLCNNVTISDISVEECKREYLTLVDTSNLLVENGTFSGYHYTSINQYAVKNNDYTNARNVTIRNIKTEKALGSAIDLGGENILCTNVTMKNCRKGINVNYEQFDATTPSLIKTGKNITVTDCVYDLPDSTDGTIMSNLGSTLSFNNVESLSINNISIHSYFGGENSQIIFGNCFNSKISEISCILEKPPVEYINIIADVPIVGFINSYGLYYGGGNRVKNCTFQCSDELIESSIPRLISCRSIIGTLGFYNNSFSGLKIFETNSDNSEGSNLVIKDNFFKDNLSTNSSTRNGFVQTNSAPSIGNNLDLNIIGNVFNNIDENYTDVYFQINNGPVNQLNFIDNTIKGSTTTSYLFVAAEVTSVYGLQLNKNETDADLFFSANEDFTFDLYSKKSVGHTSSYKEALRIAGGLYLWSDGIKLYVNSTKPTSNTDGTVVGTQT